jgi:3-oxoacyl-[acyl-carrier-protein] synthase II
VTPAGEGRQGARRRVAVTGLGLVTSLGSDLPVFWRRCLAGEAEVHPVPAAWSTYGPLRSQIWSPLGAWERSTPLLGRLEIRQLDPASRIALLAAASALDHAALSPVVADPKRNGFRLEGIAAERSGVYLGTGVGGLQTCLESGRFLAFDRGRRRLREIAAGLRAEGTTEAAGEIEAELERLPLPQLFNPFSVAMTMPNASAAALSIKLGLNGPAVTVAAACASGTAALGQAFRAIREGQCDFALAGGTELLSDPYGCCFRGFDALHVLATGDRPPDEANRPFDEGRTGFLFGEGGAALLVLEELESARRRGAPIRAEIVGYGETSDAWSVMAMEPEGRQIRRAIEEALADAGLDAGDIGYVNAHGTGTPANDPLEAGVLAQVFPHRPQVNSTKSLLGHTLGASGAIEAAVTVLSLETGHLHPSRNLEKPVGDLDYVTAPVEANPRHALSQSFAFGGQNSVLALSRAPGAGEHRRSLRGALAGATQKQVPAEDWDKAWQEAWTTAAREAAERK